MAKKNEPSNTAATARKRALALLREHFSEVVVMMSSQTENQTTKIRCDYIGGETVVLTNEVVGPCMDLIAAGGEATCGFDMEFDTSGVRMGGGQCDPPDE